MRNRVLSLGVAVLTLGSLGCSDSSSVVPPNFTDPATVQKTGQSTIDAIDVTSAVASFYGGAPFAPAKGDCEDRSSQICSAGGTAEFCGGNSLTVTNCNTGDGTVTGTAVINQASQITVNLTIDNSLTINGTFDIPAATAKGSNCVDTRNNNLNVSQAGVSLVVTGDVLCSGEFPTGFLDVTVSGADVQFVWSLNGVAQAPIQVLINQEVVANCNYNLSDDTLNCK